MPEALTAEQRAELLRACEGQNCDGRSHECWNCGGGGFVEDEYGDEEICGLCKGLGGWRCPLTIYGGEERANG